MKATYKLIAMAGVLGFLLGGFSLFYESKFGKMSAPVMVAVAVNLMAIIVILLTLPQYRLRKKITENVKILDIDHQPERYIKEMEKLLEKRPSIFDFSHAKNRTIIQLDIGLGYMALNQYNKAVDIFEEMDPDLVVGATQAAYYGFYAYSLFRCGKINEGITVMKNNLPVLKRYYEMDNVGMYINLSWIYQMLKEKRDEAVYFYWKKALKTGWGYYQRRDLEVMKNYLNKKGFDVDTKEKKKEQ